MLSLQPALEPTAIAGKPRIGLALAGGGPLGGLYELGALRALDDCVDGLSLSNLECYVGVSSGAMIAAALANRFTTREMCRILVGEGGHEHTFRPEEMLRPAYGEMLKRALSVPGLLYDGVKRFLRNPLRHGLTESFAGLVEAMPNGIFDSEGIHRYLQRLFAEPGRTNDFRELTNKLYIVAVELDTGKATRFGAPGYDHVPISRAVQASAALPGLFPPVEIDGRHYVDGALRRTLHASAALNEGLDLLLCLNPLVPYDASEAHDPSDGARVKLADRGLATVLSQTFRALIQSRMQIGMSKYTADYPASDILLSEPNRGDSWMFFSNIFSYAGRHWACDHAYQTTRRDILAQRELLEPTLARHGLGLRLERLQDPERTYMTGVRAATTKAPSRLTSRLSSTLDRLQDWMDSANDPSDRHPATSDRGVTSSRSGGV